MFSEEQWTNLKDSQSFKDNVSFCKVNGDSDRLSCSNISTPLLTSRMNNQNDLVCPFPDHAEG